MSLMPRLTFRFTRLRTRITANFLICLLPALVLFTALAILHAHALRSETHVLDQLNKRSWALMESNTRDFAAALALGAVLSDNTGGQAEESRTFSPQLRSSGAYSPLPELAGLLLMLLTSMFGLSIVVEDRLSRWLRYFRRVAIAHSRGRLSARASGLGRISSGLLPLATAMNRMADSIDERSIKTEQAVDARIALLHEIHHRVKNNFAIVASFLSLYKRGLANNMKEDVRFVEEHVHSMATAYRVAYTADDSSKVSISRVVSEVIATLGDIAGCPAEMIALRQPPSAPPIAIDRVIAVCLYLAYELPPYFDICIKNEARILVDIAIEDQNLRIHFSEMPAPETVNPVLRSRLAAAYLGQLNAKMAPAEDGYIFVMPLAA